MYLTCGCYDTEKHSASCSYAVSVLEYLTFSSSALTSSLNVPAKPVMTLLLYLCLILRVVRRIQYPPMTGLGLAGADGSASPTASLRSEDSLSARRFDLGACVVDCRSFNVVSRLERYDIGRHGCAVKRGEEGDTHARARCCRSAARVGRPTRGEVWHLASLAEQTGSHVQQSVQRCTLAKQSGDARCDARAS
jgi:hypothetical protein